MSLKESLFSVGKKIKDIAMDEDPEPNKPVKPASVSTAPTTIPSYSTGYTPAAAMSPFAVPDLSAPIDESMYQRILAKTNFDSTPTGKIVHRYFDALPDTLDMANKIKIAVSQASSIDKVTAVQVLETFDNLQKSLQSESNDFKNALEIQNHNEVTSKQEAVAKLQQQLNDISTQMSQLSSEIIASQSKISTIQSQFEGALVRRTREIDQQKSQFSMLLK